MDGFEFYLLKLNRQKRTIKDHLKILKVLMRELPSWDVCAVDSFIVNLRNKGCAAATINRYISTLRVYSRYQNLDEKLQNYKMWKCTYGIKGILTDEEIEAIYTLPCPRMCCPETHRKWSIFFKTLALTGMRPGELASIQKHQIDFGRGIFLIEHTKTGIPRQVPIPPNCVDEMKYFYDKAKDYLFITQTGKVFSDHGWIYAFDKRVKTLGIDRPHISLYSLRHSYVTRQLEMDTNIHKIAKLVGHSIEQTATYEHLTVKDIQDVVKRHPLVRKNTKPTAQEIVDEIQNVLKTYDLGYTTTKDPNYVQFRIELKCP